MLNRRGRGDIDSTRHKKEDGRRRGRGAGREERQERQAFASLDDVDKKSASLIQGIYYRIGHGPDGEGIFRQESSNAVNCEQLFCYKVHRIRKIFVRLASAVSSMFQYIRLGY